MIDQTNVGGEELAPAAQPRSAARIEDERAFMAEVRAAARHAVLVRRLAYLERLVGLQPRRSLLVVAGAGGGVTLMLLVYALVFVLLQQWRLAGELVIVALIVPRVVRYAFIVIRKRVDAARLRARAAMAPADVRRHDAVSPPVGRARAAIVAELDAPSPPPDPGSLAHLVRYLAPRVLSGLIFVAAVQLYPAAKQRVGAWLEHREECRRPDLDAAIALLDVDPVFRKRELARCPNLEEAKPRFVDANGVPTVLGAKTGPVLQASADDGARAALQLIETRRRYFGWPEREDVKERSAQDAAFREGFENQRFVAFSGETSDTVDALMQRIDARAEARGIADRNVAPK